MSKPRLLVFASGTKKGGGLGFAKLVDASRTGKLNADIVGVVSNHLGGVQERAWHLGVNFIHMPEPWDALSYQRIAEDSRADFFALSGWLKLVKGLDPNTNFNSRTVFNIHPGPLPSYGGLGMYGHHVHEAVIAAGENYSAVTMHFVTEEYDRGPTFFMHSVRVPEDRDPKSLADRVSAVEHKWQYRITNMAVNGRIQWGGVNPELLVYPSDYRIDHFE